MFVKFVYFFYFLLPMEGCNLCFAAGPLQTLPCCRGKAVCAACLVQLREPKTCPFCRRRIAVVAGGPAKARLAVVAYHVFALLFLLACVAGSAWSFTWHPGLYRPAGWPAFFFALDSVLATALALWPAVAWFCATDAQGARGKPLRWGSASTAWSQVWTVNDNDGFHWGSHVCAGPVFGAVHAAWLVVHLILGSTDRFVSTFTFAAMCATAFLVGGCLLRELGRSVRGACMECAVCALHMRNACFANADEDNDADVDVARVRVRLVVE